MSSLDIVKSQITRLYKTNPHVHMDVYLASPKTVLENAEATITDVYSHLFRIKENSNGTPKFHTLQYSQIYTGQIKIRELEQQSRE